MPETRYLFGDAQPHGLSVKLIQGRNIFAGIAVMPPMSREGSAYIFINPDQAVGFGHIGWGFHIGGDRFYYGATDHLWRARYPYWYLPELIRYMDVAPDGSNDFWARTGTYYQMMTEMRIGRHVRYHQYKVLPVLMSNPLLAHTHADKIKNAGWNVVLNNCVHQTYQIITKYGADLPSPYQLLNRFPKNWFESIPAEPLALVPLAKPEQSDRGSITPAEIETKRLVG